MTITEATVLPFDLAYRHYMRVDGGDATIETYLGGGWVPVTGTTLVNQESVLVNTESDLPHPDNSNMGSLRITPVGGPVTFTSTRESKPK